MSDYYVRLPASGGGDGDVTGPASSTDTAIAIWDGTDGSTLQDSGVLIDASDNITGIASLTATTIIATTTIATGDNLFLLNNDVTGAPSEDAGWEVERGTSTNVQSIWNETDDRFQCGVVGSLANIMTEASGELNSLTSKATPTSSDILVIEDAAASNAKKKITIGDLPASGIGGSGTNNYFPLFNGTDAIDNSAWWVDPSNRVYGTTWKVVVTAENEAIVGRGELNNGFGRFEAQTKHTNMICDFYANTAAAKWYGGSTGTLTSVTVWPAYSSFLSAGGNSGGLWIGNYNAYKIAFYVNNTECLDIDTSGNLDILSGYVLKVNGTQVITTQQSHFANAVTSHSVSDFAGTNSALDALGSKINEVISVLETHGLMASA